MNHSDPEAWEALLREHQEAVFRLAYLLLGDADEAADVAQETFINAYRALGRYDPARPMRPWLMRICANLARNRRRAVGRYWAALQRALAALAIGAALLLCVLTLAVPPARAALLALLRIGAVQITLDPTPFPSPAAPPRVTPPSRSLGSILDLDGEATLAQARAAVRFPIRLPSHPADLGAPNAAFVQDLGDQAVTLVWLDPAQPRRVKLALQILGPGAFLEKLQPRVITSTLVGRNPAVWAVGEYLLRSRSGNFEARRLISGNVLIWRDGELTYRLETDLPMAEAVRIAESLRP